MADMDKLFKRMKTLFGDPKISGEEEMSDFLNEYRQALRGFDDKTLIVAGDALRDTHKFKSWPLPAVLVDLCKSVPSERAKIQATEWKLTEHQILTSKEGQEALKHGHGHNYLIECRNLNKIVPLDGLFERWHEAAEQYKREMPEFKGETGKIVRRSYHAMKEKEVKLKEKYYGKA